MQAFHALIGPEDGSAEWWQLCVRAVILFAAGVAFVRIAGRRTFSHATALDIVVAIVIGSNLSRAMTGKAPFLGALAASLVLVLLHRGLAMATLRWNLLAGVLKGKPIVLVKDGVADAAEMRRHGISPEDLTEGLRLEQLERCEDARLVTLENSGRLSVVPKRHGS